MRKDFWEQLRAIPGPQRQQWTERVKAKEWSNADVELETGGERMVLPAAGSWLLRFLERCARYNAQRRSMRDI